MFSLELKDVWKKYYIDYKRRMSLKEELFNLGRKKTNFWALRGISMKVKKRETFGIIGSNGCGKTTLLRVILGVARANRGKVEVDGRMVGLLELGAGFHQDLTGRENVYLNGLILGLSRKQIQKNINSIIDFADIGDFIDAPVRTYSNGMYLRLGFAIAVHINPEILIIDEILAVGDEAFQDKCLCKIKEFKARGITIILVSHNLEMVRQLCDRVILMDKGNIVCEGTPEEVINKYLFYIDKVRESCFV